MDMRERGENTALLTPLYLFLFLLIINKCLKEINIGGQAGRSLRARPILHQPLHRHLQVFFGSILNPPFNF